jgi:hypothetical protein
MLLPSFRPAGRSIDHVNVAIQKHPRAAGRGGRVCDRASVIVVETEHAVAE